MSLVSPVTVAPIVDHQYPPPEVTTKAPQEAPSFVDGSGPIFSMYSERATEDDQKMAESWKADAEGILVFTGLFSAAVASLISVSIQDIRPNPQDTSNFYLANIYQTLADPGSNVSSPLPASPPSVFSPKLCNLVGTKIPKGHSATLQSAQASADPRILCGRRRQVSPSVDS
ncbi:hypothetical protein EDB83DRAFT_1549452 [Lactarius deliciosus]|nr:hypothetical protein EDB83DRAFT_1549452 [Lactarius deliciosus]